MRTSGTEPGPSHDKTDEAPVGLLIVCCLAALAGAVDASGLSLLGDLYVSFMSGDTTSLGAALAAGDGSRVRLIAAILVSFVAGAAAGTVAGIVAGRRRLPVILGLLTPLLAVPAITPHGAAVAMAFAMGMLNEAMPRVGSVAVSVTYVTGTLVRLGRGIGHLVCGQSRDWKWLLQSVPWIGLLCGAAAASASLAVVGHRATFAALPAISLALSLTTWMSKRRRMALDRT